ncbi:MAG: DUF3052 domain-containing protein [Chthoniobacterales bacterium]
MAGYSATPLWKKLGYKPGMTAHLDEVPANYLAMLALPAEFSVHWAKGVNPQVGLVHLFSSSRSALRAKLMSFRKAMPSHGAIWVSWPKKSSGLASDITEDVVREIALPLGLVDIKVCAVDEVWSGLKLMIRKELR